MTDEQRLITDLVYSTYEAAKELGAIIVSGYLEELDLEEIELLNGFHPQDIHRVQMNDAYYCDMRADTFVVMFGYDEYSTYEKTILIQANHKGLMRYTLFAY